MKKTAFAVAGIVSILLFSSCQKEFVPAPTDPIVPGGTNNSSFLVKTYTEDFTSGAVHFVETFNLSYDAESRVTSIVSTSNAGNKFVYQYNADNTYTMDLYNSNVVSIHALHYINSMGLVDSIVQHNDTQDTSSVKYVYTADKLLLQMKDYDIVNKVGVLNNTTVFTYDANRNVIKEKDGTTETTFEYYPDLLNNINIGMKYVIGNTNLPKKTTITGGTPVTLDHTYTFDSLKRVTSEKAVSSDGEISIRTFTY